MLNTICQHLFYRFVLFSVLRMKKTFALVNSSFCWPELSVSRIMKLSYGFSTSIISTIRLLTLTENGKFTLQSSQFIFLYLMTTWPLIAFIVLFLSSHVLRHFKCIPPMVPEQLHGDIIGLNNSSSCSHSAWSVSSRQIRQTMEDLTDSANETYDFLLSSIFSVL